MDGFGQIRSHSCNEVQRDRWAYRNHLLHAHREVIRTGTTTPVRLEGREYATAWAADFNRLLGASRRREALGLPRVPDQEAARRLHENRARRDCRARAAVRVDEIDRQRAARQREARPTRTRRHASHPTVAPSAAERPTIQAGLQQVQENDSSSVRTYTPCRQCVNCPCRRATNLSEAQNVYPPLRASRLSSLSRASPSRATSRPISPGPPQLWPEAMLVEGPLVDIRSQGSGGSPVNFLDTATCDAILEGLRDQEGRIPDFTVSPPGTPPPHLPLEKTHVDGHTQTGATYTRDKACNTFIDVTDTATQVASRPHVWSSATQTATLVSSTQDVSTQVLICPR